MSSRRLRLESIEERIVPAVFNIANGDVAGFIAAVNSSNINNDADTINLAVGGTYVFTDGADAGDGGNALPSILVDANNGANTLTVNGNGSTLIRSSMAGTPNVRFWRVTGGLTAATLNLNDLTMTNGAVLGINLEGTGGALFMAGGNAALNNCTFMGNAATTGGAIAGFNSSARTLSLTGCTITGNTATGNGGGIHNQGSTMLTLTNCTVTNNTNGGSGAGVWMQSTSTSLTVTGCTISSNSSTSTTGSGGGIFGQCTTTVIDSTIANNTNAGAGGIFYQAMVGPLTVRNSTVSGNQGTNSTAAGGGIFVQGSLILSNSTIHNNKAGNGGGVSFATGSTSGSITNSTITGNQVFFGLAAGGGVRIQATGLSIGNSIIAENSFAATVSLGTGPDIAGSFNSLGYNLIGDGTGATINGSTTGNQVGTTLSPINPMLSALGNNGGPTQTRIPTTGSPTINTGDPAFVGPPNYDQRGTGFPRVNGGRLDIGAAESQPAPGVATVVINNGASQRSRVTQVTVNFSQVVSLPANAADAFQLQRNSDMAPVTLSGAVTNDTTTHVTLTFIGGAIHTGPGFVGPFSLQNGRYTLTVIAAAVSNGNGTLDGNGDGTGGDNYVLSAGNPPTVPTAIFRYFGDSDGDGDVDGLDFLQFVPAFLGTYNNIFDVENDGDVDGLDFLALVQGLLGP